MAPTPASLPDEVHALSNVRSLFISHGAPDLVLQDIPARRFLDGLGAALGRPRAIVVVSAHYVSPPTQQTPLTRVQSTAHPATWHDFVGFPASLRRLQYPAPGEPALAKRIVGLLRSEGIAAELDAKTPFDHGAWLPLSRMYPQADIPVLEVSVSPAAGPAYHFVLGRALQGLKQQNILLMASGAITHNLGEMKVTETQTPWVSSFIEWMAQRLSAGDEAALLDYRAQAPYAARNHPSEEHLLPLFTVMGAAGKNWRATRLHQSCVYDVLSMDAYAF